MMGERGVYQGAPLYEFSLDRYVLADRLQRRIDRYVELGEFRARLGFYSSQGALLVDPELLIRMPLIGYCHGIGRNASSVRKCISIWSIAGTAS
jgi:hypothetical protein